jgi:hypothetical protein
MPAAQIAWAHFKMPVFVSVVHDDYKLVIGSVQSIYKPGQTVTNDLNLVCLVLRRPARELIGVCSAPKPSPPEFRKLWKSSIRGLTVARPP